MENWAVDQSGAIAGHELIAGNNPAHNYAVSAGHIEVLLQMLKTRIEQDDQARVIIEELTRYHARKSVDGLRAKLDAAGLCLIFFVSN